MSRSNYRILFVCTGNLCRSPLAEGYLRHYLAENGINGVDTASAGISAPSGSPPSKGAIAVAQEYGFNIECKLAHQIKMSDISAFNLILTMTDEQRSWIILNYGSNTADIRLLGEFSKSKINGPKNIPDPIGLSLSDYRKIFLVIKSSVEGLYEFLKKEGVFSMTKKYYNTNSKW